LSLRVVVAGGGWLGREGAGVAVRLWLGAARSDTAPLLVGIARPGAWFGGWARRA